MTDKTVRDQRQRRNQEALASGVPGTKKTGAPAPHTDGGGQNLPAVPGPKGNPKGGKGGPPGKGTPKGGKGGGGQPQGGGSSKGDKAGNGEATGYARPCGHHFFGVCHLGADVPIGGSCRFGEHKAIPSDADRAQTYFKKLEEQHGKWEEGKFAPQASQSDGPTTRWACNTPPASPRGSRHPPAVPM
jgi:hypothetical protein